MRKRYFWPLAFIFAIFAFWLAQVVIPGKKTKKLQRFLSSQEVVDEEIEMHNNLPSQDRFMLMKDSTLPENFMVGW